MRFAPPALFHAATLVTAMLLTGCEDLVTVRVMLEPIALERDLDIGEVPPDVCPTVTRDLEPTHALSGSASLAPVAASCVLTVRLEDAVLMDRPSVLALREELEGADTTALLGVVVEVRELELTDVGGAALPPASVGEVELRVDGVAVVPSTELGAPLEAMQVPLPQETVDELLAAVEEGREVRADLELRLAFVDPNAIPPRIHARIVLAPVLLVDAVRAAL